MQLRSRACGTRPTARTTDRPSTRCRTPRAHRAASPESAAADRPASHDVQSRFASPLTSASDSGCSRRCARRSGTRRSRLAGVRTAAAQPVAELAHRPGVVVEPLLPVEERVHVRVGVERHADEQVRDALRERRDPRRRRLQVAALVAAHVRRVDVVGQRARELRRVDRAGQVLQVIVGETCVVLRPLQFAGVRSRWSLRSQLGRRRRPESAQMPPFSTNIVGRRFAIACAITSFSESSARRRSPHLLPGVEVRVELPVGRFAARRAHVQDRHGHADRLRARLDSRVLRLDLLRAAEARRPSSPSGSRTAGDASAGRSSSSAFHCVIAAGGIRLRRASTVASVLRDRHDGDVVPHRREIREVALEGEPRLRVVGKAGLHLRDVLAERSRSCAW